MVMGSNQIPRERIQEILTLNSRKGDSFVIHFKDDPVAYVGIPFIHTDPTAGEDDVFSFRITSPPEKKGVQRRSIDEIESIEAV
jgi:hypothetical protein